MGEQNAGGTAAADGHGIEEKRSGACGNDSPVYGKVQAGRQERTLGNRVLFIHPEAGEDSTADAQRSFRCV